MSDNAKENSKKDTQDDSLKVGLWVTDDDWVFLKPLKSVVKVAHGYVKMNHADLLAFHTTSNPSLTRMDYELGVEFKDMDGDFKKSVKELGWRNRNNGSKFTLTKY